MEHIDEETRQEIKNMFAKAKTKEEVYEIKNSLVTGMYAHLVAINDAHADRLEEIEEAKGNE